MDHSSPDIDIYGASSHGSYSLLALTSVAQDRPDLAEKAKAGSDLSVFRGEGFDF